MMTNKKAILVGGAGIAGVAVLYLLLRENQGAAAVSTAPNAPAAGINSYPSSGFQPAPINIQEAPLNLVYNQPFSRDLLKPSTAPSGQCGNGECTGCDGCSNANAQPYVPTDLGDKMLANMASVGRAFITFNPTR